MTAAEIYDILKIRSEVFVVEQRCISGDQVAWYCCARNESGQTIVTCRVLMYDEKYAQIGRMVTAKSVRRKGVGRKLMETSFKVVKEHFGNAPILIHEQTYMTGLHMKLGFQIASEEFFEDGIPCYEMIRYPEM